MIYKGLWVCLPYGQKLEYTDNADELAVRFTRCRVRYNDRANRWQPRPGHEKCGVQLPTGEIRSVKDPGELQKIWIQIRREGVKGRI